jgi:hypothetical protein
MLSPKTRCPICGASRDYLNVTKDGIICHVCRHKWKKEKEMSRARAPKSVKLCSSRASRQPVITNHRDNIRAGWYALSIPSGFCLFEPRRKNKGVRISPRLRARSKLLIYRVYFAHLSLFSIWGEILMALASKLSFLLHSGHRPSNFLMMS